MTEEEIEGVERELLVSLVDFIDLRYRGLLDGFPEESVVDHIVTTAIIRAACVHHLRLHGGKVDRDYVGAMVNQLWDESEEVADFIADIGKPDLRLVH